MARATFRRPSPSAGIDDWLNLVDPDGAFLTASQLRAVFPHGFDPLPNDQRSEMRAQLADLEADPAGRSALRLWLLSTVLQWGDGVAEHQQLPATSLVRAAEHGVHLRPTLALLDVDTNLIRVAVFVWPMGTRLDRRPDLAVTGDLWPASPVQRAETWCREADVPLALVTDDDQWVLVWAPRGAPAASCRWRIGDLADERVLQAGLVSLLGSRRFFAVEESETLEALFRKAADAEVEITKGLGLSVRRSVELLVAAISRDDVATGGRALRGISATEVYEASVSVLMRLVFLLFAEERRLLPAEDPLWAESYSVLTLREDLRSAALRDGEDALERRSTAWHRLLATFRAVHGGVNHDRLTLPAYGGSLFDPDRFPFLEGRRAPDHLWVGGQDFGPAGDSVEALGRPIAIDDRTVLASLDALLTVEVKAGRTKVAQRVSYKALDVEQIGHCYEGLLDHGAVPIDVLSLGLVGPDGGEPEISITDLETRLAAGTETLSEWLSEKDKCDKTPSALAGLLAKKPEGVELARLRVACGHDDAVTARVLPFWGLIRTDLRGLPVVLLSGSMYVTQMSTRRNMGAQYTTKALAEEVVRYALEPLVFDPGPQNEPDAEKWQLRNPHEILNLRVCDPAVGSGAILTAAGRYLAYRLIESVVQFGPGEGSFAERLGDLAAASSDDQVVLARREVVDHCLYGVDKNPVAAEMAKLSLWLTTMARERPFTFLDHAIQVGDSLLGITNMEQLRWLHLDPDRRKFTTPLVLDERVREATELALRLQALSVITVRDSAEKQRLHEELRAQLADLSIVADTVVGAALSVAGKSGVTMENRLETQLRRVRTALGDTGSELERSAALAALQGASISWLRTDLPDEAPMPWERHCLHWPLAFPEVFLGDHRAGFDALVANPPFLGGKRISTANGSSYREHLVASIAAGISGSADLVVYFLLRMCGLAPSIGTLATNTVSQGDTREVGLDRLEDAGWTIHRAVKSEPWPNEANLEIAKIWLWRGVWKGTVVLNGLPATTGITASLEISSRVVGTPKRLHANVGRSFIGSFVNGIGFVLKPNDAIALCDADPRNREVLFPYLNGADLNDHPEQRPSRWVINFFDWPIERARGYRGPFEIVEALVKPERAKVNRKAHREKWWIYGDKRPALYAALARLDRVLVVARVSKTVAVAFVPTAQVVSEQIVVFVYDDDGHLGVLTSAFHLWWTATFASTLGGLGNFRYTPSDVFDTFPQPIPQSSSTWEHVNEAGRVLNETRADVMARTELGLTKTYNRVHDVNETDPDIVRLRELHVHLDNVVRDAYGWTDLELGHQHWATPQGMRFTVSPAAKDDLLDRLLELNHQRYAEEVAAGLHDKKANKSPAKPTKAVNLNQESLL
jgi:hypothetical protein